MNHLELITILLCTRNGANYLKEQLDSIHEQDYKNLTLWISDDGSTDNTLELLKKYQDIFGKDRFHILSGPQKGFAANFLSLVTNPQITGDFFAFSDQDDIWEKDKISKAIRQLKRMSENKPLLYCSRTRLVDAHNKEIGFSTNYTKEPSFANAIVQNIGGGNTMVFNKITRDLLLRVSKNLEVVCHDWWTYIVVTASNGEVYYDVYPSLRYRQHANNQIGANQTVLATLLRLYYMLRGRFINRNNINLIAIKNLEPELSPQNKLLYERFCTARNSPLLPRIIGILKSGVYRQTFLGNLGLIVATILKRI
jgi:glycosyltransferase involved in cell wall biosynthesis